MIAQFEFSDNLQARLSSARNEPSPIFARKLLKEILKISLEKIQNNTDITNNTTIASNVLSDLAQLENNILKRKNYRRDAIRVCKERLVAGNELDSKFAINYADKTVNLFYDYFVREDKSILNSILADTKQVLNRYLSKEKNTELRVSLLSQKSSVLRCQSQISSYKDSHLRSHEALKCSNKAVNESPDNPNSHLSLGQSLWHVARKVSTDFKYFEFMNRAENALKEAQTIHNPVTSLVLARFYRQTYRPSLAISKWIDYTNHEKKNRRRLLAESFLAGEAAMQMWYNNFNSSQEALEKVVVILREAVDSGYENARVYMALVSVEAALGNITASNLILKEMYNDETVNWNNIIEKAQNAIKNDDTQLLEKSFSIGVSDSYTWNSIGTYAKTFLKDINKSADLYEIGRHLSPKNYILLTNLSRVLLEKGDNESLSLANRYLSQAESYSKKNKSFMWCRDVRKQLNSINGKKDKTYSSLPHSESLNFNNLSKRFQFLLNGKVNPHKRGKLFESLFYDLLSLTFGAEIIQGSHLVDVSGEREVDASFKFQQFYYRVELKWHGEPRGPGDFDHFKSKLKTAEVRGLFISMSGYTDGGIKNAHEIGKERTIILMDGDDLKSIFEGKNRFELILEQKIDYFQQTGSPYLKSSNSPTITSS